MTFKTRKRTLADKINSLITTTPGVFNSDDEVDDTKAKLVDRLDESDNSKDDFQVSEIRKRNIDLLDQVDKRYKGKKVSRKDVYNGYGDDDDGGDDKYNDDDDDDDDDSSDEEEDDDDLNSQNKSKSKDGRRNGINHSDGDINYNNDEQIISDDESSIDNDTYNTEDNSIKGDDSNESDSSNDSEMSLEQFSRDKEDKSDVECKSVDIQTMSHTNLRADIERGNCVKSQLKLWENFLEVRIKLQKCLTTSNQMPQHDVSKNLKTDTEYAKIVEKTKSTFKILLNNMIKLQSLLLKQYPETKNLSAHGKKRQAEESTDTKMVNIKDPMDEEIPSDTEDENNDKESISDGDKEEFNENIFKKRMKLDNYEKILSDNHKSYIEYRNSVIEKWDEKTRVATGKWNKGIRETTMKQIEFALSDKEKLRNRSRLKRSEYKIVGKAETTEDNDGRRVQEYDSEIYDDDDFYHQLLRDLIEYKSSDITDPIQLSKQWIQLQNMRRKMKRKIDTRATKGRRIRYNVHNKLVNFMAPITVNDTWTDLAKDELYNSLFGKIKPVNREANR
ncbi:unnamed protein product [Xylocopa violacea]|uniref:Protein AATF n=1 Tax=Xylocopa violacea TaxID=135666 RepID=A0ABP1P7W1_XYLVO